MFGEKIKTVLKQKKISQQELAEYLGISRAALSNILNSPMPVKEKHMVGICKYLDMSMEELGITEKDIRRIKNSRPVTPLMDSLSADGEDVLLDAFRQLSTSGRLRCIAYALDQLKEEGKG